MKLVTSWKDLPVGVRHHLRDRIEDRQIGYSDLMKLKFWIDTQPEVAEGAWFRDFGSFILCGNGPYLSTFLTPNQKPYGEPLS